MEFPTIVNNIPKSANSYSNTLNNFALVDNKLAKAQSAIGTSSNIAQIAQTYMYTFPNEQKYKDYVCILSVLAQCAIDNAKRAFDVDLVLEIDRITKDMNIKENGYPSFWKIVKDKKAKVGDKKFDNSKINKELKCPMNYLADYKFERFRSKESTLPMSYFFQKFELEETRRKSAKVEKLIEDYSSELFNLRFFDDKYEANVIAEDSFDEMLNSLKMTYISKEYIGLMSWLLDRAMMITTQAKNNKNKCGSVLNKNRVILLKTLFNINKKNVLTIFSKNLMYH